MHDVYAVACTCVEELFVHQVVQVGVCYFHDQVGCRLLGERRACKLVLLLVLICNGLMYACQCVGCPQELCAHLVL